MRAFLLTLLLFSCLPGRAEEAAPPGLVTALQAALSAENHFEDPYLGQVWLAKMSGPLSRWFETPEERLDLLSRIHREARLANLDPGLVLAIIQVESNFDQYAISSAGARGMMQIMPFWTREIGREDDNLFDLDTNLRYGCTILAHYLEVEDGSLIRALARYNGSRGQTWYPERVLRYWHNSWRFETG
ncbi:MAG: lytic transglycosylase domain-containing protein [Saccharospirillum sp.]